MASKKRVSDIPLHKLDEKNSMREQDDSSTREEDDGRFGPPVISGYGIKVASAATLATRRTVKGRRQNLVPVTLAGEGKLGLVFVRESEPPEVRAVSDTGLAAKVRDACLPAASLVRVYCYRRASPFPDRTVACTLRLRRHLRLSQG